MLLTWRHDIQHNDTQHNNNIQHDDSQHNSIQHDNKSISTLSMMVLDTVLLWWLSFYAECCWCWVTQISPLCWVLVCWLSSCWVSLCSNVLATLTAHKSDNKGTKFYNLRLKFEKKLNKNSKFFKCWKYCSLQHWLSSLWTEELAAQVKLLMWRYQ